MKIAEEIFTTEERLAKLFNKRAGFDLEKNPELKDENFFGSSINMAPREAVLLLVDIEREFEICISNEFILNKGFTTFQNLLDYLEGSK